jgi:hypothetical protein
VAFSTFGKDARKVRRKPPRISPTNGHRAAAEPARVRVTKPYDHRTVNRSRISNGKELLPDVDGRSIIARRYRDISGAIIADSGGIALCSESRLQLIRRFSAASVLAEQLESKLANGEQIDIAQHSLLVSSLVRLANKLGIHRVSKTITPSVESYLASKRQRDADDIEVAS